MPDTAKRYDVTNAWDPRDNVRGGARYLRDLLAQFNNNLALALAAYNAGEGAVTQVPEQDSALRGDARLRASGSPTIPPDGRLTPAIAADTRTQHRPLHHRWSARSYSPG